MIKTAVKHVVGSAAVTRWARGAARGRLIAVCYHDLRRDDDFPSWLRVAESDFTAQLLELGRWGRFVGLADVLEPQRLDPDRPNLLVTFDDGYRNNLGLAAPILARLQIPAVFFVSAQHMDSGEPFWSDEVVTPIQALQLAELDLREFGLERYCFCTGDPARRWDGIDALLRDIKRRGNMDLEQNRRLLAFLRENWRAELGDRIAEYRPLTADEVGALARQPGLDVGSHGYRHEILTYLEDDRLADALTESRRLLAVAAGGEIAALAYPNGDHDARVRRAAAAAGYRLGFSTSAGIGDARTEPLAMPRLLIGGFASARLLRFQINRLLLRARRGS